MLLRSFVFLLFVFSQGALAERLELTIAAFAGYEKGKVVIELYQRNAPNHIKRIKRLVEEGKYDGVAFHRVIEKFMAQTGDVEFGNIQDFNDAKVGTGGSSYDDLKVELSQISFTPGVVGMARGRYIHSANSQFFIVTEKHTHLNGGYTVIGKVVEGLDVVRIIKKGNRSLGGKVTRPDYIKKAVIISGASK